MEKLNLPTYTFRIDQKENNKTTIFDPVRKKDVLLTPEEWVRQNIIKFLIEDRSFPVSLITVESLVKINRLTRRFDALVFDRKGNKLILIECKATNVNISQDTFDQIIAYNRSIMAPYLLVTNGLKHYFCIHDKENNRYNFLENIPKYEEL